MKNTLIKIDPTTYILLLLSLFAGYIHNIYIIILIVIIHELGHVLFLLIFKIEIIDITIYPFGGITKINKKINERIYKDFLISIGGILFQIISLIIIYNLNKYYLIDNNTYNLFKEYNLYIIIFNLIPLIPLDGNKILKIILSKFLPYKITLKITNIIGIITLIIFIIINIKLKINDLTIIIFLIIKIIEQIKNTKYILNKFYLERIIYDNYYDGIINNKKEIKDIRINKYYYFLKNNKYINEKEYIKEKLNKHR